MKISCSFDFRIFIVFSDWCCQADPGFLIEMPSNDTMEIEHWPKVDAEDW